MSISDTKKDLFLIIINKKKTRQFECSGTGGSILKYQAYASPGKTTFAPNKMQGSIQR